MTSGWLLAWRCIRSMIPYLGRGTLGVNNHQSINQGCAIASGSRSNAQVFQLGRWRTWRSLMDGLHHLKNKIELLSNKITHLDRKTVLSQRRRQKIRQGLIQNRLSTRQGKLPKKPCLILVESREAITPRPSQLDPDVQVSPHLAPDVLTLRFCSCGGTYDSFREQLKGYFSSS